MSDSALNLFQRSRSSPPLPLGSTIAADWAREYNYPGDNPGNLVAVARASTKEWKAALFIDFSSNIDQVHSSSFPGILLSLHVSILPLLFSARQRKSDTAAPMTRATLMIAAVAFLCSTAAATTSPVTLSHLANVMALMAKYVSQ